ncbi:mycothiol transferase [Streptomyces buecherae]|uniref:mycothiol transferase n=1 Tax=Streptomyces buecherae TaxID=2763006 RepID=UPI00364FBD3B
MTTAPATPPPARATERAPHAERDALLRALAEQRATLLIALRGLTDAQAGRRSTASELTLGGILKHLAQGERVWAQLISERRGETPDGMWDMGQYHLAADDTLADLRAAYAAATRAMDAAVGALPDLDVAVPLPPAPWDPEAVPETWTARRALLHMLRETAQHAGHADIIRECLDGANTTAQLGDAPDAG